MKKTTNQLYIESSWKIYIIFSVCAIMLGFIQEAAATDAISALLCRVTNLLTGSVGQGVATVGIVVIGMGLFTGKISWTTAIATALGIGIIFGATNLVGILATGTVGACSTTTATGT